MVENKLPDQNAIETCLQTLASLCEHPEIALAPDSEYAEVVAKVALLTRRLKSARKKESRSRDQEVIQESAIRQKRTEKSYGQYLTDDTTPASESAVNQLQEPTVSLHRRRSCYICKSHYQEVHHFYDALCPDCGTFNFLKRSQTARLDGRTAIVTGGRIKIGFQIALKLLRAGAAVAVTSRFPFDTAKRYQQEADFEQWSNRLRVYSADFRSLPAVLEMCTLINRDYESLDILINNAAQTVRRPPEYYEHLIEKESKAAQSISVNAKRLIASVEHSALPRDESTSPSTTPKSTNTTDPVSTTHIAAIMSQSRLLSGDGNYDRALFPQNQLDLDGQQIDRRDVNSWVMELNQVEIPELLETHAVNSMTPFILIQQLDRLFDSSPNKDRYIVNVSAVEGQFQVEKTGFHPHTNMAKASMNMITKTCAKRYAARGIYMNSVDTGWVTNEFPLDKTNRMKQHGFEPPLDEIDGAARVCDPIFIGVEQQQFNFGGFWKDYQETNW